MKLFRSIDEKLESIGFVKVSEDEYGANFERVNNEYKYTQCVDLIHKASGRHIIQSYDKELMDEKKIGNTCVGLTGFETKLFLKKMKKIGLYNKKILDY